MRLKFPFKDLKKQKKSDSGKKKAHTFKLQAIIHSKTQQILSVCMSKGAVHDVDALYSNSLLPSKAKKRCRLNLVLKTYNREINKRRIGIEHVFGRLKTFKILTERYRNRGKRLGLRFNLIAGIYNLELTKK